MKQFLSAIARVFRLSPEPVVYDTGMDNPIYDQLVFEFQQLNPNFTLTKGE